MSNSNQLQVPEAPSYISRVLNNDSTRKGAAAALAGLFVAVVSEALWPSTRS